MLTLQYHLCINSDSQSKALPDLQVFLLDAFKNVTSLASAYCYYLAECFYNFTSCRQRDFTEYKFAVP